MGRNLVVGGKLNAEGKRDCFVWGPSITATFALGVALESFHLRSHSFTVSD